MAFALVLAAIGPVIKTRWFQSHSPSRSSSPAPILQGLAMTALGRFEGGFLERAAEGSRGDVRPSDVQDRSRRLESRREAHTRSFLSPRGVRIAFSYRYFWQAKCLCDNIIRAVRRQVNDRIVQRLLLEKREAIP